MRASTAVQNGRLSGISPAVTNGAEPDINQEIPYTVRVEIKGSADLLFHAWNCEAVEEKSKAKKGSAAKKTDNVESYVYRNKDGVICMPGTYLAGAIQHAAKFRQDPRSPRKSAMDLFKAGVAPLTGLAPIMSVSGDGKTPTESWDFEHRCRVTVQRNAVTRVRPAFLAGWSCEFDLMVLLPQYIDEATLNDVLVNAGKLIGVGDFRPTYGRFNVTSFKRVILA